MHLHRVGASSALVVASLRFLLLLLVFVDTYTAWSSEGALTQVGDFSWLSPGDCEGSCTFLGGETKGNSLVDCSCH